MRSQLLELCLASLCLCAVAVGAAAEPETTDRRRAELQRQRQEAAHRPRRIIMNNDGNDARTKPDEPRTHENFLSKRTAALAGSQVDAIFYCSGVFNLYTHHSSESEPRKYSDKTQLDWAWEMGQGGPDSLATVVDFGHKNKMEVFWSMRMNDTHDSADPSLLCEWKRKHPDNLMGRKGEKFVAGGQRWSAVNYELPAVREKVFRILRDVATRYDVDGLELDFFRHPVYFKPQMAGEPVTQGQRDLMTDLLRRVRAMADDVAARRGRPLLIAVRVPDSVEYSAAIGLDLVSWMKEDLIDMLVTTGYFQLNPWKTSVELGHRYGVSVYACLSEPRFKNPRSRKVRESLECCRGRALDAWNAGVDGIYMFNFFDPHSPMWKQLGDAESLRTRDQLYPAGVLASQGAKAWLASGLKWLNLPTALPEKPIKLSAGKTATIKISVAEAVSKPGVNPTVKIRLLPSDATAAKRLSVTLNGQPLASGARVDSWMEYSASPSSVRSGVNRIEAALPPQAAPTTLLDAVLEIRYETTER
jgi:hypothetical protein